MLFTIAIPTYNNKVTINNAIDSCLKQVYDLPYEILVLDNHSNDGSEIILKEICNKDTDKLRLIRNPETVTMYENHNLCLEHAQGDYILFCHADDKLCENALQILHEKVQQRDFPQKYILWGRSHFRDFLKNMSMSGFSLDTIFTGAAAYIPFFYSGLTPSGTCYSKLSFKEAGGFLLSKHQRAASDMSTMLYLAHLGFKFEMMDQLYFNREYASTAKKGSAEERLAALTDALDVLVSNIGEVNFLQIAEIAVEIQSRPPVDFLSYLVRKQYYRRKIRLFLLKNPKRMLRALSNESYRLLVKELLK
ncbi:glycosyltransferase family 2 protein [Sporomusa malonica]|uniref:Glycosyl transferase family 2 n=1 Tax=Sporomusa malonica TaxID=112901 RepID=A0A1W1YSJ4_9FIRM|nr:glycosyltransferase family A protein [Sporomusa malonica]SMC39093.1 Glycosyl transferase family 2 [Sporomusa malonica]